MSSWSNAGISPQSAGVGEESLPAIRAYLHQVIFDVSTALSVFAFNPCNSKQTYVSYMRCSFSPNSYSGMYKQAYDIKRVLIFTLSITIQAKDAPKI